jgi:hypothetical protein
VALAELTLPEPTQAAGAVAIALNDDTPFIILCISSSNDAPRCVAPWFASNDNRRMTYAFAVAMIGLAKPLGTKVRKAS